MPKPRWGQFGCTSMEPIMVIVPSPRWSGVDVVSGCKPRKLTEDARKNTDASDIDERNVEHKRVVAVNM